MSPIVGTLGATLLISLLSLVGVISLSLRPAVLKKSLEWLLALAAGTLLGGALLHLLPEAIELQPDSLQPFLLTLAAFGGFFILENFLLWRHCHDDKCEVHPVGYLNLVGDAAHNFMDGLVIAASFVTSWELGIATTIAIALHEIPQELGDFAVLIHAGFGKVKAILLNLVTAGVAIIGGVVGLTLSQSGDQIERLLLPLAAGGFLYIASADLIPELQHRHKPLTTIGLTLVFGLGIALMWWLTLGE